MSQFELLHESFDARALAVAAEESRCLGRQLVKLGFASFIQDHEGNVLVAAHEARDGEYEQGALGPIMETFRYVPSRGRFGTETPAEILQRSLLEEIKDFGQVEFEKAGFYFDRKNPLSHGEWSKGRAYAWAVSLIVKVREPEQLIRAELCSEEILHTRFMPIDAILATREPVRPGYLEWLRHMRHLESLPIARIKSEDLAWKSFPPAVMRDVRYPFDGVS